jgi:hypothetical protein
MLLPMFWSRLELFTKLLAIKISGSLRVEAFRNQKALATEGHGQSSTHHSQVSIGGNCLGINYSVLNKTNSD